MSGRGGGQSDSRRIILIVKISANHSIRLPQSTITVGNKFVKLIAAAVAACLETTFL